MRALLFTSGSPFARAVRIVLHEIGLDYVKREETTTTSVESRAAASPTLQVPTFWDGDLTLWESGLIAEYLVQTYPQRPAGDPPLAPHAFRPDVIWHDRLVLATVQTFGIAATTISQMTWTGVRVADNAHLSRSAEKLSHILGWLEQQLDSAEHGFMPHCVSIQDIFLASHVRFIEARPLGLDLGLGRFGKVRALMERLDARDSFQANPIWWWEPGIVGYLPDGTPVHKDA